MTPRILHAANFAEEAADFIARAARESIAARGTFRLSLCGGNTPRPAFRALADRELDWSQMIVTFSDERCVPPESEQSNFRMAHESLLSRVAIPESQILRLRGEIAPELAAQEYEEALRQLAPQEEPFVHDLLLLGLGDDGHTASLFPETVALGEQTREVVANYVPKVNAHRLTFTFRLINAARAVCFLVNDPAKQTIIDQVIAGGSSFPSASVQPTSGNLTWLLGPGA